MAKKTKKRSMKGLYLSIYGIPDMVEKMERVLGDVQEPLARAYKAGMAKPEAIMLDWFDRTDRSLHPHRKTGRTAESFYSGKLVWQKDGTGVYEYGFKKDEGGLAALFFEYGTPKIKPQFVMYYAVNDNLDVIAQDLQAELMAIMKEKGLA
jgi:hypothetical protein